MLFSLKEPARKESSVHPCLSDSILAEPVDFEKLRNEIVTGPAYAPSFGRFADLQKHIDMLEREFVGQIRLKFVHAVLNVLLRRGIETELVFAHFRRLWAEHSDILLETLDSRWLVSACDTICDYSADPDEARTAILVSLFANTLKLSETERLMMCSANTDSARIKRRTPIFDGMTAFMPEGGDMIGSLLQRLDQTLQPDGMITMIGREVVTRTLSSDTLFSRFARLQKLHAWPNHLSPAFDPCPPSDPEPTRIETDPSRPGYILVNDTGRLGNGFHMGTVYACNAIRRNLCRRGMNEIGWANDRTRFDALLSEADRKPSLVILNGEGTLHHGAPRAEELMSICLRAKEAGIAVAVVNSVWESNSDMMADALRAVDLVHVRDWLSFEALPAGVSAEVTPDVSIQLFLEAVRDGEFRSPQYDLGVIDSVVQPTTDALLGFAEKQALPFFAMPAGNLRNARKTVAVRSGPVWPRLLQLTDLMNSRAWITGRFHGLIAALCAGLPVCALRSNTSKVEGFLRDAGLEEACLLDLDWPTFQDARKRSELARRLDMQHSEAFIERRDRYIERATGRISKMFDAIADLSRQFTKKAGHRVQL